MMVAWKIGALTALAMLCMMLAPSRSRAELKRIWALDDGTKVKATELNHRLASKNGVFTDGKQPKVRLVGARNETVAFQLILQGGAKATKNVGVKLDSVGPIRNAEQMSDDPDRYWVGRRIELLAQHYLNVTERSHDIPWAPGSPAEPKDLTGWIPDALVPLQLLKEGLAVSAKRNQGVWVDLYIPKDTPAGTHRGELVVTVGAKPCGLAGCKVAVELEVLAQTLPDRPTAKTMLTFSATDDDRDCAPARYLKDPWNAPDAKVEALRERHFKLMRRHRITGFLGHDKKPTESLRRRISGESFSAAGGYDGPGVGLGQDMYSIHTYGTGKLNAKQAKMWVDWFAKNGPKVTYFFYVIDEPSREDFGKANTRARAAKPVPAFITTKVQPGIEADIFCALPEHYSVADAKKARGEGKKVWIYNGTRPFSGSFMTDDVAVAPRVNAWIQHKHGIARWFYWEATYYKDDQGGRKQVDIWSEANNYRNSSGDRLNGDGLLIYPGRDVLFPKQDRGFDGPLSSIRLKNWRRGIQDVEYLAMARKAGHGETVDKLLAVLLPKVLVDETEATAPVSWPEDGEKWLAARLQLAKLLAGKKADPIDTAKLAAPTEPTMQRLKRGLIGKARSIGKKKLLAIVGFGGLIVVVFFAYLIHRRRSRRRDETFE